ncbi:hypothetical protein AAXB25_14620 [Paenibacillus lautus]|uniref:hypothetical protein n=1 Tax=Paenibacillus lautus TaxID=1401 RepID=UPI003D2D3C39
MSHKNFDALRKAVLAKAKESMRKDVLPYVQDEMVKATQKEVYDVYPNPKKYKRRESNGGLLDRDNIVGNPLNSLRSSGFEYEIHNNTQTNFGALPTIYLTPLVVMGQLKSKSYGYGSEYLYYNRAEEYPYGKPRDFISETKNNIDKLLIVSKMNKYMNK